MADSIDSPVRLTVHAKPGSRRESVTLGTDAAGKRVLVVKVSARAVEGAANRAVAAAVAHALGLRSRQVEVVMGVRSRTKIVEVRASSGDVCAALSRLRDTSVPGGPDPGTDVRRRSV